MLENELQNEAAKRGLEPQEAQAISDVLNVPEVRAALEEAEKWRKIKFGIYLAALAVTFGFIFANSAMRATLAEAGNLKSGDAVLEGIPIAIVAFFVYTVILAVSFRGSSEKNLKSEIISRFLKILEADAKYSPGIEHGFGFNHLVSKGLLSSYDRVDTQEDSFEFTHSKDGKSISVRGLEIMTSEMRGTGKNRRRVTTNRCFLMKGDYPETKFKIEKNILIKTDAMDSIGQNLVVFAAPAFFAFVYSFKEFNSAGGSNIAQNNSFEASMVISIAAGAVVWFLFRYFMNKNRVKLENVAFEKLFDVKCEDQIVSRMVLTPAFMDRLLQFVERTRGSYEFLFDGDVLYVKKILTGGFLEVNGFKNVKGNTKMFLKWYAEIKEAVSLISDTGVLVFSKTDYSLTAATNSLVKPEASRP